MSSNSAVACRHTETARDFSMRKRYRTVESWSKLRASGNGRATEEAPPMNKFIRVSCCALLVVAGFAVQAAADRSKEEARLLVAAQVLDELRSQRDQAIPQHLLQRAYAVAVIPSVTKVALVLGGRRGNGVMV